MPKFTAKGFTLIEVMLVLLIIGIAGGVVVLGVSQSFDRRLDSQALKIVGWMESLSDRSVLEGGIYGFRVVDNQLQAVSWFDHQWFLVEHEGIIELPRDMLFDYLEDEQPTGFVSLNELQDAQESTSSDAVLERGRNGVYLFRQDSIEPMMVFLPSGRPISDGELILTGGEELSISLIWDLEEGVSFEDVRI